MRTQTVTIVPRHTADFGLSTEQIVNAANLFYHDVALRWAVQPTWFNAWAQVPPHPYIVLLDEAPAGSGELGDHDEEQGHPTARVYVGSCLKAGISPLVVLTHEVAELLADPFCNAVYQNPADGVFWGGEVSDPVQGSTFDLTLNDGTVVPVSDYVLPSFFDGSLAGGAVSRAGSVQRPFSLGPIGYASVFNPRAVRAGWHQIYASLGSRAMSSLMKGCGRHLERRRARMGSLSDFGLGHFLLTQLRMLPVEQLRGLLHLLGETGYVPDALKPAAGSAPPVEAVPAPAVLEVGAGDDEPLPIERGAA